MTRVKESLNLFYHGLRESEKAEMFHDVQEWLIEMDNGLRYDILCSNLSKREADWYEIAGAVNRSAILSDD